MPWQAAAALGPRGQPWCPEASSKTHTGQPAGPTIALGCPCLGTGGEMPWQGVCSLGHGGTCKSHQQQFQNVLAYAQKPIAHSASFKCLQQVQGMLGGMEESPLPASLASAGSNPCPIKALTYVLFGHDLTMNT